MNNLDRKYQELLTDIQENGHVKGDRTGTGTVSVFGRTIRHDMSEGFPLLTTKKMAFKTMAAELMWFLHGDNNIKYLVDNGCNIWNGDAYKYYVNHEDTVGPLTMEQFVSEIKTNDEFTKKWGDLGPIYGVQWRKWGYKNSEHRLMFVDQIAELVEKLRNNPNDRRMIVSAWNVPEIPDMKLPPCHYSFQCNTRLLTLEERHAWKDKHYPVDTQDLDTEEKLDRYNVPTRAISLIWNQRSVDTFLGLPFNIASYGLLLEILAKEVNMVPDELIGMLGDTHLYLDHIEQAKLQGEREPYDLPTIELDDSWKYNSSSPVFADIIDLHHIKLVNYKYHDKIVANLSN